MARPSLVEANRNIEAMGVFGNSSLAARRLFDLNQAITSGVRKSGKRPLMFEDGIERTGKFLGAVPPSKLIPGSEFLVCDLEYSPASRHSPRSVATHIVR
jgi:hypothetical protein